MSIDKWGLSTDPEECEHEFDYSSGADGCIACGYVREYCDEFESRAEQTSAQIWFIIETPTSGI